MNPDNFTTLGLVGRFGDQAVYEPASALLAHLRSRGLTVLTPDDTEAALDDAARVPVSRFARECDLVVAIGGDGTMLHAVRTVAAEGVPLVGVNRGRLGFLTDISPDAMAARLDEILAGRYVTDPRHLIEAAIHGTDGPLGEPGLALNEIVLQKHGTGHMLDLTTHVNGTYLNSHGGDGLIIATPTGSTAYALSCGGPIIQPDVDAMVLVPICPHTLSDRPLVVPGSSQVECRMHERLDTRAQASCDGELLGELGPDTVLHIRMSPHRAVLLHPEDHDYYGILRDKLHWGRDGRRRDS